MKMKKLAEVIAVSIVCSLCAQTLVATETTLKYAVTNFPSLGGTNSEGNSINEFGLSAGYSNTANDRSTHATAWISGARIDLKTLGGVNSDVVWPVKNDFGIISGISQTDKPDPLNEPWSCAPFFYGTTTGAGNTCLGFVWVFGEMFSLPPLSGGNNSFATGTNNRLQTVGWAENGVHDPNCDPMSGQILQFLPVIWGPGRYEMQTLPLEAGDDSGSATAINDRGDVAGISGACDQAVGRKTANHMILWKNGRAIDIGNIGGNAWNTPMAMNEQDDIVGFANTKPGSGFTAHAFFWSHTGGPPLDLGVLYPGDTSSQALGINNRGQVVGLSCGPSGCRGFLWQNRRMTDLNSLTSNYNGVIDDAQDINDLGEITGQAYDPTSGTNVAFFATPIDHHHP